MLLKLSLWQDVHEYLEKRADVVIPVGGTEQHGPSGPLGTDLIIAEELASDLGEERHTMVAPPIAYGVSQVHGAFPGTISVKPATLLAVVSDAIESLYQQGFRRFLLVNAHHGSKATLQAACAHVHQQLADSRCLSVQWWELPEVRSVLMEMFGAREGHHATPGELSIVRRFYPRAVLDLPPMERFEPVPQLVAWTAQDFRQRYPDGRVGSDPSLSSGVAGDRIFVAASRGLVEMHRRLVEDPLNVPAYALIAEPDPGLGRLYGCLAAAEGLEVKIVRDAIDARALLRTCGAPALTITELSLPGFDAFQLIREIRKLAPEEHSPIIAISAFRTLRDTAVRMRGELEISAMLAKPAPVDSIRRAVKKVLASSQAPHGPAPLHSKPPPSATLIEIDEERAEEVRLHRLDQMALVDEGAEQDEELHRIVVDAAKKFNVPVAAITLVLEDKQWFKAHVGLSGSLLENRGSKRAWSFCTHVVQGRQPLVVPDAAAHPSFAQSPLVQDGSVGSYAGAPIETSSGDMLGALCIIDSKPAAMTPEQLDELGLMARGVAGELELRGARKRQPVEQARLPEIVREHLSEDKRLQTAVSCLTAVLDNIDNGVFLLDPQRQVVFANQALADMFGVAVESLLGNHRDEVVREAAGHSSDPEDFLRRLRVAPTGPYALRGEFEMERPRRRFLRWVSKPIELGDGIGQLTVVTDTTAAMDLTRERDHLARTDPITGLMNRRAAEEVLEREASRAQRFGSRISVALIDIDHFKQVNDRFGHAAGDDALRAVAQILNSAMRGVDVAARWGGDELVAILPATGLEGARSFAERVRAAVERLNPDVMRGATLSIGVAELQLGEDWADAVRRADARLYEAKDAGRNRVA